MSLDPREVARQRIDQAVATRKHRDEKADAAIWAAVVMNCRPRFRPARHQYLDLPGRYHRASHFAGRHL